VGFIDKLAKKILGKDEYEEYVLTDSMDGCAGESTIAKIREKLKKLIPC